ncbi:mevalonate kinase [Patescibacteria group bacterium]|nr:mevalonate kinase [Patescibacteria group bacterium]MCL5798297.1 mevalonate kinase [Patescibacteria group bacterium]
MNSKVLTVVAPGKLMLFGEHAVIYGYPCIVSALDKYIEIKGKIIDEKDDKFDIADYSDGFIRRMVSVFRIKYGKKEKIFISSKSTLGRYGLGSSAAISVATVKMLGKLFNIPLSAEELFNISYEGVLKVQKGKASGFDLASSIYGGTILFDGKTKKTSYLNKGKLPFLTVFTGRKAKTVDIVKKVAQEKLRNPKETEKILSEIGKIVLRAERALKEKNWKVVGKLMNDNQKLLVELGVSNGMIDKLVKISLESGALGAKISGAGGGDCILVLVERCLTGKVVENIEKSGGTVLDINVGIGGGVKVSL